MTTTMYKMKDADPILFLLNLSKRQELKLQFLYGFRGSIAKS